MIDVFWGTQKGKESVESVTKSITAAMEIPDYHRMEVVIVAQQYKTTVPYSATLTKKFYDGSKSKQIISGMYKGVDIDEVKVEYGKITPLASITEVESRKRRQATPCGDDQKARFFNIKLSICWTTTGGFLEMQIWKSQSLEVFCIF